MLKNLLSISLVIAVLGTPAPSTSMIHQNRHICQPCKSTHDKAAQAKRRLVKAVIECESSGVHDKWGDLDYPYPAYGIAQMQERTFRYLAGLMGIEAEWDDELAQIRILNWAIDNGYGKYWSCYRKLNRQYARAENVR